MSNDESKRPVRGWQVFDALFGVLFVFAAVVNLNDADAVGWVVLYGSAAAAVGAHLWKGLSPGGVSMMGVLYFAGAVLLAMRAPVGSAEMAGFPQAGFLNQEVVREALGLALVSLWCAVVRLRKEWAPDVASSLE